MLATGTFTEVAGTGGNFDYTVTLDNTGTEAIQSFWMGWIPGAFDVASPSDAGNNLGWTSTVDGNSVQYGGTAGTALAAGQSGTFTFDSTTTPTEIEDLTAKAGESTVYGVNDPNQFDLSLAGESANTETFDLQIQAVPEPSSFTFLAAGFVTFLFVFRRKASFAAGRGH
ncbi:MAG TPA: PEP-CTERM sorting domain-containing protein [Alphaproteobacteria bacterium]|nr:PEP-CTERM sorting domain-containing protein [Alphaproteobacteria bacterium]